MPALPHYPADNPSPGTLDLFALAPADRDEQPVGGLTSHRHPDTSVAAGDHDFTGHRSGIHNAIEDAGSLGLTAKEVADLGLASSVQLAGARLLELRGSRAGFEKVVARRTYPDGKLAQRDGAAIHWALDQTGLDDLWPGTTWEPDPVVHLCPHCGHKMKPRTARPGLALEAGDR